MTDTSQISNDPVATQDGEETVDPRHQKRVVIMQALFAVSFKHPGVDTVFDEQFAEVPELNDILESLPEIDQEIQSVAPERPLTDINKVDLAILRLIMFESKRKKTPKKVLINEAVELAKEFGTESSPRFVNGVLAHLLPVAPTAQTE